MGVFFHILSTGGGSGASRITRYIAERDKNLEREGPGSRRLFSEDEDNLSYHRADRILDPGSGQPDKDDLIHFSVMIEEEEFDKLGSDEKEKQAQFREAVREAMKGMAAELNVEELTWVGGIHRNSQNPHVHIVMNKDAQDRQTGKPRRISRIPKRLLPHKEIENGKEVIVNGPLGDKFLTALEKQKALHLNPNRPQHELTAAEKWEQLARNYQKQVATRDRERQLTQDESAVSLDHRKIAASWNSREQVPDGRASDFRIALGKRLELEMRLLFAEVWHDRALRHGDTYRFEVMDQSTGEERKISDLDVRRRAAARASRLAGRDHDSRNQAIEADLANHTTTLQELEAAREAKIEALGKDIGSLRGVLSKVDQRILRTYEMPAEGRLTPLVSRESLSELQQQAVRLNLPECTSELERLRVALAREHDAPTRTDVEAAMLVAQFNVSRADLKAKETRLENFEASIHLTTYEVAGDRWSLAGIDNRIARRNEDAKLIPERAARLDLRSLARLNYSASAREQAAAEVESLRSLRTEVVGQIEERRAPLIIDRDLALDMVDVLQKAYESETRTRARNGEEIPEPKYERHQVNALESSAEILRDPELIREVDELEKSASKNDQEINWEGRAVAREILSEISVQQSKQRLEHFLESKRVASLNLGEHRTGSIREVETRTLTDYLARAIESRQERDHRHSINVASREHHGRLVSDFEKAKDYHATARDLASEAQGHDPQFTDKERINLEIYGELQNDTERERYLELAASESRSQDREVSSLRER
jgi:MobL relaxases